MDDLIAALIAFLTARLDEKEAAARAAELRFPGPWDQGENTDSPLPSAVTLYDSRDESVGVIRGSYAAAHIARHDPARMLCEVAAERAIIARYEDCLDRIEDDDYPPGPAADQAREYEDFVLPNLAVVNSDHPDYKPEWKLG